jgi:TPR repeat protein
VFAACYELGLLYEKGSGVPREAERALALFKKACTGGEHKACDKSRGR